jgi:hypothetical protein
MKLKMPPSVAAVPRWTHLPLCLVLGALLSLIDRTDVNWDLQNYHLYDPFALLHGRLGLDYYAAGYQSYFNPLADIPYYLAKFVLLPHEPRLVALLAGLPFGVLVFIVLRLAPLFVPGSSAAFFAALLGLTGATTLSEVGTAYDDILVTDFMLVAMLALTARWPLAEVTAGLLCGLGVALKLTVGLFAVPLAGMLLVLVADRRLVRLVLFGTMTVMGFALGYGWWAWQLWQHFANPFYPMFGGLFHSRWALPITGQDVRFFPRTWPQWLAYPFFWLQGKPFVAAEIEVRDPRFALAYLAALAGLWCLVRQHMPPRPVLALWLFFVSGYVFWLLGFSILRYAIPLEVLSGVFIATVLCLVRPKWHLDWAMALLAVFCLVVTKPMGWGRISYGKAMVTAPLPVLPPQAIVLMAGHPIGFILPYIARPDTRFVGLDFLPANSPEWSELRTLLAARPPVLLLTNEGDAAITPWLMTMSLRNDGQCVPIHSQVQKTIELCRLQHFSWLSAPSTRSLDVGDNASLKSSE